MRSPGPLVVACLAALGLCLPAAAGAHPAEKGEVAVPWVDDVGSVPLMRGFAARSPVFRANAAPSAAGSRRLSLVGNADNDGTTNTDMAFHGTHAYAGTFDGFRVLDISRDRPRVVADVRCRGPQSDLSVYKMGRRTYLFQSVDMPQTRQDCASEDTPFWPGDQDRHTPGFEGLRMFDVTDPARPRYLRSIPTACGSHTHTLVPDRRHRRLYIYVSSYPLGPGVTPAGYSGPLKRCTLPHRKISIVRVPFAAPTRATVAEQPLSRDTTPLAGGLKACHDIQVFMPRKIAVASCLGDAQLWDISRPGDPSTRDGDRHTHIRSPSRRDRFEFVHSAFVGWRGTKFAVMDETGGGMGPECNGRASTGGFYYFYKLVKPGARAPRLRSRYTIPRRQAPELCTSHNGGVIPIAGRDLAVAAYYQGGNTVIDFTNVRRPREVAYADLDTPVGLADSWSAYWFNGRVFANGGHNRRGDTGNRGLDVFRLRVPGLRIGRAKRLAYSNAQTQETSQVPR